MDYGAVKEWDNWVNDLYNNVLGMPEYTRYVLDAPEGPKGGHCVTPNAIILNQQFPNVMVEQVAEIDK
jgi:hypothetical protein